MKRTHLFRLLVPAVLFGAASAAMAEPQWIWLSSHAKPNERVTLRHEFTIAGEVKSASLSVSVDNGAKALINGTQALDNPDWSAPSTADVKALLHDGKNELRLDAKNNEGSAAAVAILSVELSDGGKITVETGSDWQAA